MTYGSIPKTDRMYVYWSGWCKVFEMSTVVGRDKDYPNEQHMSLDSYTTQRLKLRLKKYFGDNFFPSALRSHYIRAPVLNRHM